MPATALTAMAVRTMPTPAMKTTEPDLPSGHGECPTNEGTSRQKIIELLGV